MSEINKVFDDLKQVDYITVDNVTDSSVDLVIHLKTLKVPQFDMAEYKVFNERCIVLGKMLDRKISLKFVSLKWYNFLYYRLLNFFRST